MNAALLALAMAAAPEKGTDWALKEIRVFNGMGDLGQITAEKYDATGGAVEVTVNGNAGGICPGGSEKLRFTWRFARDVSLISAEGAAATIDAVQLSKAGPCTDGLAGRSYLMFRGSAGVGAPFSEAESQQFDIERFWAKSGDRISPAATNVPKSGSATVGVSDRVYATDRSKAYFEIAIITPTRGAGLLRYVYVYVPGRAPGSGGTKLSDDAEPTEPRPTATAPATPCESPPLAKIPAEMLGTLYGTDHVTEYQLDLTEGPEGRRGRIVSMKGAKDSRTLTNICLFKGDIGLALKGDFVSDPPYENKSWVCETCTPAYSRIEKRGVMRGKFSAKFFSASGKGYIIEFKEDSASEISPGKTSYLDFARNIWWRK